MNGARVTVVITVKVGSVLTMWGYLICGSSMCFKKLFLLLPTVSSLVCPP